MVSGQWNALAFLQEECADKADDTGADQVDRYRGGGAGGFHERRSDHGGEGATQDRTQRVGD